jgi:hypothetical protein
MPKVHIHLINGRKFAQSGHPDTDLKIDLRTGVLGVNVMLTILANFTKFLRTNWRFSEKQMV